MPTNKPHTALPAPQGIKRRGTVCLLLSVIALLLFAGCEKEQGTDRGSLLVVDGRIDAGGFPVVKLTRTASFSTNNSISLDSLSEYVDRWAKVSISDGEHTEIMVGRYDKSHYPPFIYTSYDMRGEVGKTYKLRVETADGLTAEASTTIPAPTSLKDLHCIQTETDTLFLVYATASEKRSIKLFTQQIGDDNELLSAQLGLYDAQMIADDGKIAIRRGRKNIEKIDTPFFTLGKKVHIKCATLDAASFSFWRSYEDMMSLSRIPLMPMTQNLKSNIGGGLGCWCGYGSTFYEITIK